jgi:opacity protein-like surface antigen
MKCRMFLTAAAILSSVFFVSVARSEMYVAGQVGYTSPNDFSDVEATVAGVGSARVSDLALKESVMYGAKVGYFFSTVNWLGVEAEVFNTTPHLKQQSATFSGPGGSVTVGLPGAYLRVLTTAFNVIVRYPGQFFQPYAGVGLGLFFADLHDGGGSSSDNAVPGLNALAGARFFVTKNVALFGEYKYNRASFSFEDLSGVSGVGLKGDYSVNHFAAGVSFHFQP